VAFAPIIPEEASFGVGLFLVFMAFVFLVAMRAAYSMTFGYIFSQIARLIRALPSVGVFGHGLSFDFLATPFEKVDNYVYHALGAGIAQTEHAWHKLILWNTYVLTKTADEIALLSYDTLAALRIVHAKTSPAAIQSATRPFVQHYVATLPPVKIAARPETKQAADGYAALTARVAKLEHEIAHVHSTTVVIPATGARTLPADATATASTPVVLPAPRTADLERGLEWTKEQVRKLGKLGTVAGLLGLGAAVLGRLGLGWLRCSRVGQTGRQLCGMDQSLLESLLADTLLIVGTISLVEFAEGMQQVTADVIGPIRTFWRAA